MSTRKILNLGLAAALACATAGLAQTTAPPTPAETLKQVDARLLAWDTAKARTLFDSLPASAAAQARVARGRLLTQERRFDDAANELTAAASASPADPSPAIYLGEAQRLAERPEAAKAAFEMAATRATNGLKTSPDNVRLLVALGVAKQNLRQLPEAITALQKARQLSPDNADVAYQLGVCQALNKQFAPAVDNLTVAVTRNPEIAYAYYFRALSAEKIGRKDLLINDLQRFLALAPGAPDAPRAQRLLDAIKG